MTPAVRQAMRRLPTRACLDVSGQKGFALKASEAAFFSARQRVLAAGSDF